MKFQILTLTFLFLCKFVWISAARNNRESSSSPGGQYHYRSSGSYATVNDLNNLQDEVELVKNNLTQLVQNLDSQFQVLVDKVQRSMSSFWSRLDQLRLEVDQMKSDFDICKNNVENRQEPSSSSSGISDSNVCTLPVEIGPCRASIPMYYFDADRCRPFNYGGCHGNGNRFSTTRECEAKCKSEEPTGTTGSETTDDNLTLNGQDLSQQQQQLASTQRTETRSSTYSAIWIPACNRNCQQVDMSSRYSQNLVSCCRRNGYTSGGSCSNDLAYCFNN